LPVPTQNLQSALSELVALIAQAKRQLVEAGQTWRAGGGLGMAHDELEAVVAQSAAAADSILEACEELDRLTDDVASPDGALKACTMRIFEACTFQDLVAQRVKKVVGLIQDIERRLCLMRGALETPVAGNAAASPGSVLLNGPALVSPRQEDIDRLFAD
jgi:chemotaxis protein CheZ